MKQSTNNILMIRPIAFRMSESALLNSNFRNEIATLSRQDINNRAQEEFDNLVNKLRKIGVNVIVIEDTLVPETPFSIFPTNWISFHESGDVAWYSLLDENRRLERREDVLDSVEEDGFVINEITDYSSAEEDKFFLEGTASMVLDRQNGKAYCAVSPLADEELFIEFCEDFEFSPIVFEAFQTVEGERKLILHTNRILCVAETFAIICAESIDDKKERKMVLDSLRGDDKELILISEAQANHFVANAIEILGADDRRYLVMSTAAHQSLTSRQLAQIEEHTTILSSSLDIIESCGDGSARSMIAEVFLPEE